ncbi:TlyA family RNA methyltransferase [Candidatus Gracilibacteria bacterium]|nr:TlyA family RNA methyltransferase [Candidatus Gracilibacteria bacterium]
MRLDQYLVIHHHFTRNKAQQLISSELIVLDKKICTKASQIVPENATISITPDRRVNWVSRSAEKLAGFLEHFPIGIDGKKCLDIGSSTGGFTQVLLSYGASRVDAVDVGTDQLHESIRSDSRVHSYEQTDIRDFAKKPNITPYDIIVCDASFISLYEIINSILFFANTDTRIILLYKPQFEVGRDQLRKTGVPKDPKIVEQKMIEFETILSLKNIQIVAKEKSTLIGEAGNQEWIYMIQKTISESS